MCGIAGVVDQRRRPDSRGLDAMLKTMRHRGPDDEGTFVEGPVAMGMRRLSIIDLGGGHQPIANEDRSVWVVFNGEIYNFVELRAELVQRGHVFATQSDTEVLVHLYEEHGDSFATRLNGMFAFAIWDTERRRLLVARDQMGIKPLYWSWRDGRLSFASELKCLLAGSEDSYALDRDAIAAYLHLGYIPREASPFREVRKLRPGFQLVLEDGSAPVVSQYWSLAAAFAKPSGVGEADAAERARELLADAVRLQLRSDVPVGTFLSGGIDSSGVTALAAKELPHIDTFGVGFTDHYFDETPYARAVAKHVGSKHHERIVEPGSFVEHLEKMVWHLDEPNSDPAMLPSYIICEHARRHVKVALSGNGGDELFAGYRRHFDPPPHDTLACKVRDALPAPLRRFAARAAGACSAKLGRRLGQRLAPDNNTVGLAYWVDFARKAELMDSVAPWAGERFNSTAWIGGIMDEAEGDWVNRRLYYDSTTYMPDQVLAMVDRSSMAVSLEVRVPFLDVRLVEFMASVRGEAKIGPGEGKRILKAALRGIVPQEVFDRPKLGFGLPVIKWIESEQLRALLAELPEGTAAKAGLIDGGALAPRLADAQFRKDYSAFVWNLLMLELWMRTFGSRVKGN